MNDKTHLYIGKSGKPEKYTYPRPVIPNINVPERDREAHGKRLSEQLISVKTAVENISTEYEDVGLELETSVCIQLSFESFPEVDMEFEKLADVRNKIEVLSVTERNDSITANILVPSDKFGVLENKISEYLDPEKDSAISGSPKRADLINAISSIRLSVIENLWTDSIELYPSSMEEPDWFEIWLPVRDDRLAIISDFKKICQQQQIRVADSVLEFPERTIMLVHAPLEKLGQSSLLLSMISEIRKSKATAEFFDTLDIEDQHLWADELLERTTVEVDDNSPFISILDTGINIGHPLLSPFANTNDLFVVEPSWTVTDENGHGTSMAGLAVWGDLSHALSSSLVHTVKHGLESIKLLRNPGDNRDKHPGQLTATGVSLSEIQNFQRKRIFALAVSAKDSMDRGKPSAWSSEIDALASDYLGENLQPRLFLISAGNADGDLTSLMDYPQYNELQDIHDPAQSWNALTIGAYTQKDIIREEDAEDYSPLAPHGGLSPYSSTSVTWHSSMPIKPEVVFEGGNMGVDSFSAASIGSLQLLSTHHDIPTRLLSTFNATSAATALASKFAAEILLAYPNLWQETVRGLIVHSAEWTDEMINQFSYDGFSIRKRAKHLARVVGYGVPNLKKALWSANNSLVMIVEDKLQPFEKLNGRPPSTKDMHIHDIPWPKDVLLELGDTPVKMTVTLSYFIEPNPSSRNVSSKYRYPSHQFRFDVKRPTESRSQFLSRLSRAARDEEQGTDRPPTDPNWLLGEFRNRGSIHKDVWSGSAAELAERGSLAVYPAMGWWRTRNKLERYDKCARYSLIISIETPSSDIDLYTPVENELNARVDVENTVEI